MEAKSSDKSHPNEIPLQKKWGLLGLVSQLEPEQSGQAWISG